MMLKNVIFDIGNVLMGFDADNYGSQVFADKTQALQLQQAINAFHLWDQCDFGLEPVEEIIERFAQSLPGQEEIARQALFASVKYVKYAPHSIPWIKELKAAGYNTYYLSNYNEYLMEKRPDILDFIPYMDGGVFSCKVHLIKPDPAIYHKLMSTYGLKAEECVFLDDRIANIEAARKLGMQGILVKNHQQAYEELKQLLKY